MRLYHQKNGYHFETSTPVIVELKAQGWIEAPKGFQKTLDEPVEAKAEIGGINKTITIQRGRPPKAK